jgi:TolA-binding protein
MPRSVRYLLVAMAAIVTLAGPAAAQDMTTSDLTRLQQTADQINSDLIQLRQRDRAAARAMQAELVDLDDEITYLKVKMRKERSVPRFEFNDLRERLDNLRSRVRGDATSGYYGGNNTSTNSTNTGGTSTVDNTAGDTVPAGTELDVRLSTPLTSDTAQVEDRFEATTLVDVRQNGRVIIPAGSVVRGVVTDVKDAGRVQREGSLTLTFDQIRINGRIYPMRGSVTQALEAGGYK